MRNNTGTCYQPCNPVDPTDDHFPLVADLRPPQAAPAGWTEFDTSSDTDDSAHTRPVANPPDVLNDARAMAIGAAVALGLAIIAGLILAWKCGLDHLNFS